jgi:hypothetical protein
MSEFKADKAHEKPVLCECLDFNNCDAVAGIPWSMYYAFHLENTVVIAKKCKGITQNRIPESYERVLDLGTCVVWAKKPPFDHLNF